MVLSKYIATGKLTDREIKKLKDDMNIYKEDRTDALIGNNNGDKNISIRNSTVFFPKAIKFPKTFNILQSTIIEKYYGKCTYIDLTDFAEIQYARYDKGCFFKKHRDTIYKDKAKQRVLTFSINMSNENDYTGGELIVFDDNSNEIAKLSKEIGSYIIFPSILLHEATEVTSGLREAIVTWIHTDHEKHTKFKHSIYND